MASNIQVVIELLLKNKKELDAIISSLKEKHGIDIDTGDADAAMANLQASVEEIGDTEAVIDADASGAVDAADEAEAEIEEIPDEHTTEIKAESGGTLQTLANVSLAYQGFLTVAKQVYDAVDKLNQKYLIQERAETELAAALKNTGKYSDEAFEYLKKYSSGLQAVTTEGDEAILSATALAQNIGDFGVETIPKVQEAAIGLAAAYGMDLRTSMMLVARASKGQAQTLTRYGIVLDTTASKEDQFNELLVMGADKFKLAKEQAKGLAGQMDQVGNSAGDLQEDIGANLTPAILSLKKGFLETTKVLMDFLKLSDYSGKAEALKKEQDFRAKIKDLTVEELAVMQQLQISDQLRIGHNLRAFQTDKDRVEQLSKENEDLMMQRGVLAEILTIKQQTQSEEVEHVKEISDELQALVDAVKISIKIDMDDSLEDLDVLDDALFEKEMERQAKLLALKGEFAQRGYDLNTSIYQQQLDAIDDFYERKREDLIEAGLTEEEITEQSEQAKAKIREQYNRRAIRGTSQALGNLAKAFRSQGKKGFKAAQTLAVAQAYINMYSGATGAYKSLAAIPLVGPALGIAAAAAAIAAGRANIKQIKTQKFAGGGVVEEETEAIIGEEGPEAVVPLPDGKSIPVKGVGSDSPIMKAILVEMKAMNLNLIRQKKNITFIIKTSDPETTVKFLNETEDRMTEANDVN